MALVQKKQKGYSHLGVMNQIIFKSINKEKGLDENTKVILKKSILVITKQKRIIRSRLYVLNA